MAHDQPQSREQFALSRRMDAILEIKHVNKDSSVVDP